MVSSWNLGVAGHPERDRKRRIRKFYDQIGLNVLRERFLGYIIVPTPLPFSKEGISFPGNGLKGGLKILVFKGDTQK